MGQNGEVWELSTVSNAAWRTLVGALFLDVQDALSRQEAEDTPTNRRGLLRALIAAVEGLAWLYREHVKEIAETMGLLSGSERSALAETSHFVSDDGRISEQRRFISTTAMVRLTARIAAKCALADQPDFGVEGWVGLKKTIGIRNRITHPKAEHDLAVSTEDILQAKSAFYWFAELMMSEMARATDTLRSFADGLWEVIQLLGAGDEAALALYRRLQDEEG